MLTTPYPARRAWDAQQPFRVERARAARAVPDARARARRIDALAREVARRRDLPRSDAAARADRPAPRRPRRTSSSRTAPRSPVYGRVPVAQPLGPARCCAARPAVVAAGHVSGARGVARPRAAPLAGVVVPPGVDVERFRPLDDDATTPRRRARFGLDPDRPLVLGLSRLVPRKGFDVVIDAVARARPTCSSRSRVPAATARGSNGAARRRDVAVPRPGARRRPARALRVRRRVRDVLSRPLGRPRGRGLRDRVPRGGRVRRPAVAGRSGGSHEAVVDGETGFVVEPRDVDAVRARDPRDSPTTRRSGPDGRRGPARAVTSSRTTCSRPTCAPSPRAPRCRRSNSCQSDARGAAVLNRRGARCDRSAIVQSVVGDVGLFTIVAGLDVVLHALDRSRSASASCCSSRRCRSGSTPSPRARAVGARRRHRGGESLLPPGLRPADVRQHLLGASRSASSSRSRPRGPTRSRARADAPARPRRSVGRPPRHVPAPAHAPLTVRLEPRPRGDTSRHVRP